MGRGRSGKSIEDEGNVQRSDRNIGNLADDFSVTLHILFPFPGIPFLTLCTWKVFFSCLQPSSCIATFLESLQQRSPVASMLPNPVEVFVFTVPLQRSVFPVEFSVTMGSVISPPCPIW